MAQQNIIGSLFGITPESYQLGQARQTSQDNLTAAQLTPGQLAGYYAMEAGSGLGRATAGLLGVEDPQLGLIRQTNQLVQQIGVDTPEKLQTLAGELQKLPGGGPLAMQAIEKANSMMKTGAEAKTAQQKIDQEKLLREELAKLGDNPTDEEYLRVFRKFGTPDQQAKAIEMSIARKAKLAGGGGGRQDVISNNGVKAGYVDAKGNFFNNQGKKISAAEQTDAQKSHDSAMTLLYKLENITEDDINKAFGSLADYTTMTGGRLIGPTDTIKAQTKINSVGISSVLDNLSKLKGASSDKEMTQMIKDFPGYQAKPEVMKDWIDRAVATTNRFLQRSEKRYGFDTDYGQEGRFTGAAATPAAPGQKKVVKFGDLK